MHLFTYGSLMYSDIWQSIVQGQYLNERAILTGYQRVFIKGDRYPVLRSAPFNSGFTGTVYFDLNVQDVLLLDRFEGDFYQRRPIIVKSVKSDSPAIKAQAYLLKPQYQHLASTRPWTEQIFEQKHKALFKGTYGSRNWR